MSVAANGRPLKDRRVERAEVVGRRGHEIRRRLIGRQGLAVDVEPRCTLRRDERQTSRTAGRRDTWQLRQPIRQGADRAWARARREAAPYER